MDAILRATNLTKSYAAANGKPIPVLRGVSLDVQRGEVLAIVGASGAGKSTLLHLLSALDKPDAGEVQFFAEQLFAERPTTTASTSNKSITFHTLSDDALAELRNRSIGFIFQFHHLLPEFTALENVMMPALIAGAPHRAAQARATSLLESVGLADRLHNKPDALSGGEQQRVAFARALTNKPAVVFADEPTGNLDHTNSERVFELMRLFRDTEGQTFIIVTHSSEIARACDRTLTLVGGVFE